MNVANKCCNPHQKRNHASAVRKVQKNTPQIKELFAAVDATITNSGHICKNCLDELKTKAKAKAEEEELSPLPSPASQSPEIQAMELDVSAESSRKSINMCLKKLKKSPIKHETTRTQAEKKRKFDQLCDISMSALQIDSDEVRKHENDCVIIKQFKKKFKEATYDQKYMILTSLPLDWGPRKIEKAIGCAYNMASRSRQLVEDRGLMSCPLKKMGSRRLDENTMHTVKSFYYEEEISRACPGKGEYVRIKEDGKTESIQRRMLMVNLNEAYAYFKELHPQMEIGLSKFAELRPRECVPITNKHGFHNVCVCVYHQNVELIFDPLKRMHMFATTSTSYKDILQQMLCNDPTEKCQLNECEECPGYECIRSVLESRFNELCIEEISFKQWITTGAYKL